MSSMIATTLPLLIPQNPQEFHTIGWASQLPPAASTFCDSHDALFYFTFYLCLFFFVLITAIIVYSVIKYRRRYEGQPPASMVTHNTALEVTWTVVPLILVMIIFAWGFAGVLDMSKAPEDSLTYEATAKRWVWEFKHWPGDSPMDVKSGELHVPVDTNVLITTKSDDVLHSLFIPAFRVKRDVLPGRYQTVWFRATRTGRYPLFCTEYCGQGHSNMIATVYVHSKERFAKREWRKIPDDPIEAGKMFFEGKCKQCHSNEKDKVVVGPSFYDLYGKEEEVKDTKTGRYIKVKVDDDYIINSIRNPMDHMVKGFEKEVMTPFDQNSLKDEWVGFIIKYMKTLKPNN